MRERGARKRGREEPEEPEEGGAPEGPEGGTEEPEAGGGGEEDGRQEGAPPGEAPPAEAASPEGGKGGRGGKMTRRTAEEVEYLEKSFQENPLPNEVRRTEIAKILGIPERKVMIWFQNKRQRMKQKLKYVENINLKEENDALQRALTEERQREEYLRRENRELKVMLGTRQQRMEELRSRASRLLIEYYANKSEAGDPEAAAAIPKIAQALGVDDFNLADMPQAGVPGGA